MEHVVHLGASEFLLPLASGVAPILAGDHDVATRGDRSQPERRPCVIERTELAVAAAVEDDAGELSFGTGRHDEITLHLETIAQVGDLLDRDLSELSPDRGHPLLDFLDLFLSELDRLLVDDLSIPK